MRAVGRKLLVEHLSSLMSTPAARGEGQDSVKPLGCSLGQATEREGNRLLYF